MSWFWIFQDCQYARVLNFQGYTGFTSFHNYDVNMRGFWICVQDEIMDSSEYSRIPSTPSFCICKHYTSFWVWLNNAWLNYSDYDRVLNMPGQSFTEFEYVSSSKYARAWNMTRLWICKVYIEYWICLRKPEYVLMIMPQYMWIYLNNAGYSWICLYISE